MTQLTQTVAKLQSQYKTLYNKIVSLFKPSIALSNIADKLAEEYQANNKDRVDKYNLAMGWLPRDGRVLDYDTKTDGYLLHNWTPCYYISNSQIAYTPSAEDYHFPNWMWGDRRTQTSPSNIGTGPVPDNMYWGKNPRSWGEQTQDVVGRAFTRFVQIIEGALKIVRIVDRIRAQTVCLEDGSEVDTTESKHEEELVKEASGSGDAPSLNTDLEDSWVNL